MTQGAQCEDLDRVKPSDFDNISSEIITIGMGVSFSDKGDEHTYYILGVWDQDDDLNIISSESGLAKALLGSKNGDTVVVPDGEVQVKKVMLIKSIKNWIRE